MQYLIIINGPSGSGKTHLGQFLAKGLRLPYLSKDGIKELLFNHLGWNDRKWSNKLGATSFEILFYILESQLKSGISCIVETAFLPEFHTIRFLEFIEQYQLKVIQVFCTANGTTLLSRFKQRIESGERHPGHADHLITDNQFKEMLNSSKYGELEIGGSLYRFDTTDLATTSYDTLVNAVKSLMNPIY